MLLLIPEKHGLSMIFVCADHPLVNSERHEPASTPNIDDFHKAKFATENEEIWCFTELSNYAKQF
jgi:hypothetical protein